MLLEREQEVMRLCETPRTLGELATELNVGYYTVRNCVQALIEKQIMKEAPWRKGKQKLFQTVFSVKDGQTIDTLIFSFNNTTMTSREINSMNFEALASVAAKTLQLASVKPLWEWHVRNDVEQTSMDGHPSKEMVFEKLRVAHSVLENLTHLAEQLINAPVWENNDAPMLLIGTTPVDWSEVRADFQKLADLALERGW